MTLNSSLKGFFFCTHQFWISIRGNKFSLDLKKRKREKLYCKIFCMACMVCLHSSNLYKDNICYTFIFWNKIMKWRHDFNSKM